MTIVYVILVLALIVYVAWFLNKAGATFRAHPEVGRIIKNSFKKRRNSMKIHNFSEYSVVMADGFIFEILETKRTKGRIWSVKINVFNASDETKYLNLSTILYKWGMKEIELSDETQYKVKPGTGLISSANMIAWTFKKPSEISIMFQSNDKPGYVAINSKNIMKPVKTSNHTTLSSTVENENICNNDVESSETERKNLTNNVSNDSHEETPNNHDEQIISENDKKDQ